MNKTSILLEDNIFDTCFEDINSEYKFYQCCINDFGLVEPTEYLLGHDSHEKKESFQYIPILKVLQTILIRSDVKNHVLEDVSVSTGGILGDFRDGSIFRDNPFFSVAEKKLQIQLYTDEFEVLNCLGSKKLKHKILTFYFVIINLPLKYRSQLQNIMLLSL